MATQLTRRHFLRSSTGLIALLALAWPLHPAPAADEGAKPVAPASGEFVSLFNGRDFSGWRFGDSAAMPKEPPSAWKVENGVIIGAGDAKAILASQWEYESFEFEFEWRVTSEGYDADFYVHSGRLLDAAPMRIAKGLEGGPQENDRGEGEYNAGAKGMIGGQGKARKAVPALQKPVGEWNTWRVLAEKNVITLTCNGQQAWTCNDYVPRCGYLGFRVFQGPLELRNMRVRELSYRSLMDVAEWEVYPGLNQSLREAPALGG